MKAWLAAGGDFVVRHARAFALYSSLVIVTLWTVLRHISNGINFDVVGQIGLVDQWMHGLHAGSQVGPTNYILKMPLYALVNTLHFLSANNRLLLLALICNAATFWLLFIVIEKMLKLYKIHDRSWLYMAMVWLATISGSVYWVDYANSRNLETIGGLAFVYLTLKFMKQPVVRTALLLVLVGSLTFFADSLQVFVIGVPVCLYVLLQWLVRRTRADAVQAVTVSGLAATSFIISKLLFVMSVALLPLTYLALPTPLPALTVHNVVTSAAAVISSTFKIFDADFFKRPVTPNALRELLNAIILAALLFGAVKLLRNLRRIGQLHKVILFLIGMSYVVYVASGQALQFATERYLIMVPLLAVVGLAALTMKNQQPVERRLFVAWGACLAVSTVLVIGALAVSWPSRFSKDSARDDTISFLRAHHFDYAVSSREIGIPATYYAARSPTVLPAQCGPDRRLTASTLFYDQQGFKNFKRLHGEVPIISQSGGIVYAGFHCNERAIIGQFGPPKYVLQIPGVGIADIYDAQDIKLEVTR